MLLYVLQHLRHLRLGRATPGFGFAAPGFGFAAPGFGFTAPGFGFAASGFGLGSAGSALRIVRLSFGDVAQGLVGNSELFAGDSPSVGVLHLGLAGPTYGLELGRRRGFVAILAEKCVFGQTAIACVYVFEAGGGRDLEDGVKVDVFLGGSHGCRVMDVEVDHSVLFVVGVMEEHCNAKILCEQAKVRSLGERSRWVTCLSPR